MSHKTTLTRQAIVAVALWILVLPALSANAALSAASIAQWDYNGSKIFTFTPLALEFTEGDIFFTSSNASVEVIRNYPSHMNEITLEIYPIAEVAGDIAGTTFGTPLIIIVLADSQNYTRAHFATEPTEYYFHIVCTPPHTGGQNLVVQVNYFSLLSSGDVSGDPKETAQEQEPEESPIEPPNQSLGIDMALIIMVGSFLTGLWLAISSRNKRG